ncbi:hypothetical protein A2380_00560 [candidate division WWE3 bacterium RIFOXYB1_FULL_43_24]|uniref:Uncharacterized protein n=2 Tax=Katanobacteria TaxID=422282 RepID=A0A0G0YRG1_UNCKA|nr:MAG: hypothetical protein UU92_C0005G0041 [candidate division WWE3 bacterium GW2011_GWA1_42_12]KKS34855.1 MAG: hypothetical protein UU97_C0005G0021 [candidate division WWE3 bacterium GW2011_GWD1_42_14]KKS39210.1 MAG: hypothetical protein UV00_C0003G0042 [candidate division WWE3 bacterium GW2011_GWF1_42_14]KKS40708.1 MAG: hypothetical protein UV03_C0003G0021 [candidate division WWE3 bacterium GW2011_GWE1_42_16]KKS66863.1 MAG: hypothetical protein UV35_C0006G0042 [candidate division WWE3 bacte
MAERFNSDSTETFTATDGTEGWLGRAPTQEELAKDSRKQAEANESMRNQIAAREEKLGIAQPPTKELIDSLQSEFDVIEPETHEEKKPDTDEVIAELRELFKN